MTETNKWRTHASLAAAIATALLVAGCGGGGGGGGSGGGDTGGTGGNGGNNGGNGGNNGGTPITVSGKAADGYLNGATVCLDTNGNMKCDTGEPSATTGAGGAFTLTIPEGVNAAAHATVVEVSASTIDEDTSTAVGSPYVLSAPAGQSDFISPLTTAVHGILERNPSLTLDEAAAQVKLSIGATADVSLFEDYVAAKQDETNANAEAYERLHRVAQVSAKVLAENHEAIMSAATAQGIDSTQSYDALITLIVGQVLSELETAAQTVDSAGDSFDLTAVNITPPDFTDLAQQIETAEDVASAAKISIESLMDQGVWWMYAEDGEYEYGKLEAAAEAGKLQEQWFGYNSEISAWEELTGETDASAILGAQGWQEVADTAANYTATYQTDGSGSLAMTGVDFGLKFTAAEVDVSGKPIKAYLGYATHQPFAAAIDGSPLFSTGAKIYQVNFIVTTDTYTMSSWFDCAAEHADPQGNCNIAFGYASNTVFRPAKSFGELIYPASPQSAGNWFSVGTGIEIRVVQNGVLEITDRNAAEGSQISQGSWEYKTVHGQQLMMLKLPEKFSTRLWDRGQQFLVVNEGYVRRGVFLRAGTPETVGEIQFNETALLDIKDRLALAAD